MAAGALLPIPMARLDFLKASHFKLGPDSRLHADAMHSTMHRHFPGYTGVARVPPCQPPPRGSFFQQDARWAAEEHESEMHWAFAPLPTPSREQERSRERTPAMQRSNLHMHADARSRALFSTTRAHFGWPGSPARASEQIRDARLVFDRDSVPPGDPAKLRIPPTTHQALFQPHDACPQPRASSHHLGEHSLAPVRFTQPRGSQVGRELCALPQGTLAMSGDHFGCHSEGENATGKNDAKYPTPYGPATHNNYPGQ